MDVNTGGISTLELLKCACRLCQFTQVWLEHPTYSNYRPLFTSPDESTTVKYVMEVMRPFRYWTLWMSKSHTVTFHHVIAVYYDTFHHMDGVMQALAKNNTPWKDDLFFAMTLARQKLSNHYTEVTPSRGMHLISAHILNWFHKLQSFEQWEIGMDITPEDETSYTTQYQQAFPKYLENENCARRRRVPVNTHKRLPKSNLILSGTRFGSCQSSRDPYDMSRDDEEYLTLNNVAETTPGRSDRTARLLTSNRLHLNLPPEAPMNWGQIDPNLYDYHSDPMEISNTFWSPDIAICWCHQEETHSKYADLSNIAHDKFSIITHCPGVEAS